VSQSKPAIADRRFSLWALMTESSKKALRGREQDNLEAVRDCSALSVRIFSFDKREHLRSRRTNPATTAQRTLSVEFGNQLLFTLKDVMRPGRRHGRLVLPTAVVAMATAPLIPSWVTIEHRSTAARRFSADKQTQWCWTRRQLRFFHTIECNNSTSQQRESLLRPEARINNLQNIKKKQNVSTEGYAALTVTTSPVTWNKICAWFLVRLSFSTQ